VPEAPSLRNNNNKRTLTSRSPLSAALFFIISAVFLSFFTVNPINAETGMGKDVFKVIVSILGITKETGDFVATVTVNGNSKVKSYDIDNLNLAPSVDNSGGQIIEYLGTFPGVEVKPGDKYKVCILLLETTDSICHEGTNSLGKRPEVVDISLDKVEMNTDSEEVDTKEVDTKEVDTKEVDSEEVDTKEVDTKEVDTEDALGKSILG
jgi:hypothetical protein